MAYGSLNDEHINKLRQMLAQDNGSIQRRLKLEQERDAMNDLRDAYQAPTARSTSTSHNSKFRDPDLKIQTLTDKNEELTKKYAVLLEKTNMLVDAFRRMEVENKTLKMKKDKRESWDKFLCGLWEGVDMMTKKIILWFKS